MRPRFLALAFAAAACGNEQNETLPFDAAPDALAPADAAVWTGSCWPVETAQPGGSITLGTTDAAFAPLPPDELQLTYGGQDAQYGWFITVRQTGFGPGDPINILNVTNPRTRIRAYFVDTGTPLITGGPCPHRIAYRDIGGGAYESVDAVPVAFDSCWRSGNLIGKQIRIEGELLDWNGVTYAHETHVVTALAPTTYPDEPDAPGCPQ